MGEKYLNNENIPDAKTANQISQSFKEANEISFMKANLKRWKKEFRKNLDDSMKSGKFACIVSIPENYEPVVYNAEGGYLKEEELGKDAFINWLENKGYKVEIWHWFFKIEW